MNRVSKRNYPIHSNTAIVSARMPIFLIKKLDKACKETGRSRSDFINQLLLSYFSEEYLNMESDEPFGFETEE